LPGLGIVTGLAVEAQSLHRAVQRSPTATQIIHAAGDPVAAAQSLVAKGAGSLLSFGIAGGLDPALRPGQVIVATEIVVGTNRRFECQAAWRDDLMDRLSLYLPIAAPLAGSDKAIATVADKAALHVHLAAAAVDMESHAVARVAARAELPFAAVRIIADPATRALPSSALAGMNDKGETQYLAVFGELARHPLQLPGLVAVALDSGRAFFKMGRCAALLFGGG
jgi:hopanoid-associated phosphorylase